MLDRLRTNTRAAHVALEDTLALLQPPLSRARFVDALQGFAVFHRAWEPRVAELIGDEAFLAPRRRLSLLASDLTELGSEPSDSAASDGGAFDLSFVCDEASAWGSLYVMEGSTLGGQVISKALRDADTDWAAERGLGYFNPYGHATAAMWRAFCARLEAEAEHLDTDRIVAGAQACFLALRSGLSRPLEAVA